MQKSVLRASALAVTAAVALAVAIPVSASADIDTPEFIQPTAGATQINLLGFNDFHGRILNAEAFAATVLTGQAPFGAANSLILSNGDAVGASVFESSILKDEPTIAALNAFGVQSFTVGNHEFDKGPDDATGRIQSETNGPDLAANVTAPDGTDPFDEYALFTVAGLQVAVIGAVTQETPSLSSAGALQGWTFSDPVEAVNRVAAQLTDGDPSNGEADVLIASYHEGAPSSNVPLEQNEQSAVFKHIVQDTAPSVAAIYTAHTHQVYAYDAPNGSSTRPVLQTGSYAANVGQVVLTVDADGAVTAAQTSIIPSFTDDTIPAEMKDDARVQEVAKIVADAKAKADVVGNEKVGAIDGSITRAKQYEDGTITADPTTGVTSGGVVTVEDDRANASSLSDMVAQSMVEIINARGQVQADIGLMNPGGVRSDLIDDDGILTYKDAANVVPFANDLDVVTITGAVLKEVLEQQWQRDSAGAVPSRAYLQLGVSDDFTYSVDSTRPEGDRVTSMTLRGAAIDPAANYNIAASSFLATGGDNFRGMMKASALVGTGLIDTDAFPAWIRSVADSASADTRAAVNGVLVPDNRRNGFDVSGLSAESVLECSAQTTVSGFDLASLGYVQNSSVEVSAVLPGATEAVALGSADVSADAPNTAAVTLTIPEGTGAGAGTVIIAAQPSGSTVQIPVTFAGCAAVTPTPTPTPTATPTPTPTATAEPTPVPTTTATPAPSPTKSGSLPTTGQDGSTALIVGLVAVGVIVIGGAALAIARTRRRN
ncbi:bifunctional metallophosphatase/5'-nucleotidase [Microbacterium gorillae]|uniref:bifunctional metallophosphatase/5'-nucleotidase n=1 Tax=Microbacterium gorillae TaxID=1231063 RepID=UPI0006950150|nr:bifunctional UDP-sugar hydrolase/5'-nucleotidase [Microbacterium gorillae]